ncbi:RNA polymerase ECF-type sigma factor [Polaribacter irgensii 23-P]|uniref:RNA polymerase ECF-type sigma factor n=1 Tax=Polaribacter irgensii 23-P TaxID=313594 RepID=A4BY85_9FLAO|nr:RNA polymerase sigma-70 factor [Polaribacter irgensii]EAR13926.1 RNA polymerase ECF-type sigma factor [Polaribacter irgensii 23-P]
MDFNDNLFLAEQMKLGNAKAYDFLMHSFYQKLCGYAYTLSHDHAAAQDIVQNVFVKVWSNKKNINTSFSIKSYLYKSVYNEFINQYRKNKPVFFLEKKYLESVDLVVENSDENLDQLLQLVDKEIRDLPPKCREIFLLNKKEGLTHIEISEHLNISIKTIEGHMTRAFKILRNKLHSKVKTIFFLLFDFNCAKSINNFTDASLK